MALMEHVFFHDRHAGDLTWLTRARGAAWDAAADTHTPTKDGGRVQELLRVPLSSTVGVCVYLGPGFAKKAPSDSKRHTVDMEMRLVGQ